MTAGSGVLRLHTVKIEDHIVAATLLDGKSQLQRLNERSRTILRRIVESYLATGEPVAR